MVEALARYLLI